MFTAESFGELCDAVYTQRLACHSSYRAEAVSHSTPRADCRGSVFALGSSGGAWFLGSAAATLRRRDPGGVVRMKSLARSVMWWPGMDADIEALAKACTSCKAAKSASSQTPLQLWWWLELPWQRVHIDFAGPFHGKMFMLVVDAHSKWPEILEMTSTTALNTIANLRLVFSAFGLPEQLLVTDNGPLFVSREYADFMQGNGIKHICT